MNAWAIGITTIAVVACISYWTAQTNMEDSKQKAFMMEACVKAGGSWQRDGWSAYFVCLRPETRG